MLHYRLVDSAAAVERRARLTVDAMAPQQAVSAHDLEAFQKAAQAQNRQKLQDAFNQQVINGQIDLVGQATKIRDKAQS